jgi:hypothetical protein
MALVGASPVYRATPAARTRPEIPTRVVMTATVSLHFVLAEMWRRRPRDCARVEWPLGRARSKPMQSYWTMSLMAQ